jgi:hypothetical protein
MGLNDLSLYTKVRPEMKTGDHLGWRSNSAIGYFIRVFSRGDINHSSIVIKVDGVNDHRFDLGANKKAVELHKLSWMLREYRGEVWWYPLKDEYEERRQLIEQAAFKLIDIGYDYNSLIKNMVGRVSTNMSKLFCSETYNLIMLQAGIGTGYLHVAPTPADIDQKFTIFKDKVQIL